MLDIRDSVHMETACATTCAVLVPAGRNKDPYKNISRVSSFPTFVKARDRRRWLYVQDCHAGQFEVCHLATNVPALAPVLGRHVWDMGHCTAGRSTTNSSAPNDDMQGILVSTWGEMPLLICECKGDMLAKSR
jgi:hypothetical protein